MVKNKSNITEGPLFLPMLKFAIPLIISGILQVFYNMADSIIVGKFSGDFNALGAVGCAGTLTNLMTNILITLSVASGVVIAQLFGARDKKGVFEAVHGSLAFSAICGIVVMLIGFAVSRPVLIAMGTQDAYLENATLYAYIICAGIPAVAVYNFGASILRASGDSKTSLYILSATGLLNVLLNLVLVIFFDMSVDGVAIATVIAQYASAATVTYILIKRKNEDYSLSLRKIRIYGWVIKKVLRIGIPMAIQTALFSLSNVLIASAVNTFPPNVVEAKAIAFGISAITDAVMSAFAQTTITFIGQNYGARNYLRLNKVLLFGLIQVTVVGLIVSYTEILLGTPLAMLYIDSANPDKEAIIDAVTEIFKVMLSTYFLCGVMDVCSGVLKAFGRTIKSMVASLIGLSARVFWVLVIVPIPKFHTITGLFVAYVIAWTITITIQAFNLIYLWRKLGIKEGARLEKEKLIQ